MRLFNAGQALLTAVLMVGSISAYAHPGGVDKNGGHTDRNTGEYHCHRDSCEQESAKTVDVIQPSRLNSGVHFEGGDYDREEWMTRWSDFDGDCQDTRHEMLISESEIGVAYKTSKRCRVVSGRWLDPYTLATFNYPKKLDVDHVIPLAYAHRNGGDRWSPEKKAAFAEDPMNLLLVSARENRKKSDKGPARYMPPESRCDYVTRWNRVAQKYRMVIAPKDLVVLKKTYGNECMGL